jgi:hypothetical protein
LLLPITEGYFLVVAPYYLEEVPQFSADLKQTGSRPLDCLVRVEVVEVAEGGKIKAKSSPEGAETLKVGDVISLVRPGRMTTEQIRNLPALIPRLKETNPKIGELFGQSREAVKLAEEEDPLDQARGHHGRSRIPRTWQARRNLHARKD